VSPTPLKRCRTFCLFLNCSNLLSINWNYFLNCSLFAVWKYVCITRIFRCA
jgi:hypothetical protein